MSCSSGVFFVVSMSLLVSACGDGKSGSSIETASTPPYPVDASVELADLTIENRTAYITSQCYTKTKDDDGSVSNPCYSCHSPTREPNYLDDSDLQLELSFPRSALENPYSNLFEDRSAAVDDISDEEILEYVRTDNYVAADGTIILSHLLRDALPENWDVDGDGHWDGYVPDCHYRFDEEGFDRTPDGGYSGWRAYGYFPFLGTFWPTNGSMNDVLMRLGEPFRQDESGVFDIGFYKLNLAIVKAMIQREDVAVEPVDENRLQVDLDRNGVFNLADTVVYDWAPNEGRDMSYVGRARMLQAEGKLQIAAGLFPVGTEFLHSVRYVDPRQDGTVGLSARLKELRHARKETWYNYSELWGEWHREAREKREDPDVTKAALGDPERGMRTKGWRYQGFIEDRSGNLRPQTQEETFFCMGCHGGLGATTDTVFSFPRSFGPRTFQRGWYHWSQKGLDGTPELVRSDGRYEYSYYLENNQAGDEFRANDEVIRKFFDADGNLIPEQVAQLHGDMSVLLFPSRERALRLNKAYRVIVRDQDFVEGRDATVTPPVNVHREVTQGQSTGIAQPLAGP